MLGIGGADRPTTIYKSRAHPAFAAALKGISEQAEIANRQIKEIGFDVGLNPLETARVLEWVESGDPDMEFYGSPEFEKLFDYFAFQTGEMPYGTAKARDGMPDEWILDYLAGLA